MRWRFVVKEKLRVSAETGEYVPALTEDGRELPDPTPMAPPVGFKRSPPLHERIRALVQHEFEKKSAEEGYESPEEADDFEFAEDDAREGRFALAPGHEHEWEENYEPPKDFKDMKQRLIDAGWTPPAKGQEKSAVKPATSEKSAISLDAATAADNTKEPPRGSDSKASSSKRSPVGS